MRFLSAFLLALGVLVPHGLAAATLPPSFDWAARFVGKADHYGFAFDDQGVSWKTGRIARGCPDSGRGLIFKVTETPGLGFGQVFPNPNQKRAPVFIDVLIDPTKLDSAGSRAVVELDSPFVPIGGNFDAFVIFQVERQPDGSLELATFLPLGVEAGTPLVLPEDTPGITATITFENDAVDVEAAACDTVGALTPIVTAQPLVFGGSAGLGVGIGGAKGDSAGFAFAISGDIHDPAKQDILEDLQAIIDLETAALADLGAAMNAEARTKIEQARVRLEDQGPPIPDTMPEEFEPDLLEKVGALPESAARDAALKKLRKAAERDAKARDKIDKGKPADLQEARKQLEKAQDDKLRAKAILETGVAAEGKGKL